MKAIVKDMPSIKKLNKEIRGMKFWGLLMGKNFRKKLRETNKSLKNFIHQVELFDKRFSDKGWVIYDNLSLILIEEVNKAYDEKGEEEAEGILIEHYSSSKVEEDLYLLRHGCEEITIRYEFN
ncbi:hypothetical protein [Clostridium hydrogeniformans]|uniref:hypothetical protein n=1 Tax=Clostridium hydrogeniformans TaxID=349933 RepID=UPI0004804EA5|nr:hypothetical protein [Clostridium hydrogeniformans]